MHVVHVTAPSAFGGLERVLAELLPALVRGGFKVSCIAVLIPTAPEPTFLDGLRGAGVNVIVLRIAARSYLKERRQVLGLLQELGATVVHTHGYRSDVIIGRAARLAGYPVVSTLHGFTRQGWRGRLYEWAQLQAVRRFDAVVAVSNPLAKELEHRGIPRDRLWSIQNGLSGDASSLLSRTEARASMGLPVNVPVVGWVGRLSEEKDPELAVAAVAAIRDSPALLAIVGDGPMLSTVRETVTRLGVSDRVYLLGVIADAGKFFRAFDVLLLSSRTEGTPMTILEAAVAHVPVVATAVGGVPALIGERSPLLVPYGDAEALAIALSSLLSDPAAAQHEGMSLQSRLRTSTSGDWVECYRQLYADTIVHGYPTNR